MYKKLINVVEQRTAVEKQLQKKKAEFEDTNSVLIAQLEDLKEKETLYREEAILNLEKDELSSVEVEDKIIYSQVRITKSIGNANELGQDLLLHADELARNGVNADAQELFGTEIVVKDKASVLAIAKKYNQLTGRELAGIAVKQTKFLTIKDK